MKSVCNKSMARLLGRIVISTRVLQNLNQFTLKNHEKWQKIDIWQSNLRVRDNYQHCSSENETCLGFNAPSA